MHKKCSKCKEIKGLEQFYVRKSSSDGREAACAACTYTPNGNIGRTKLDLVGQKFGRLTVLKYSHLDKRKAAHWECICECGKTTIVRRNSLIGGRILSCGCYMVDMARERVKERNDKTRLPNGECNFNIIYKRYIRNAQKRNYVFDLTKEEFRILILSNCHYCNSPPNSIENTKNTNGHFLYNGIDRKDNEIGYVLQNCLSCCSDCNWLKGASSYDFFIEKVIKIAKNFKDK